MRLCRVVALACALALGIAPAQKKNKEEQTQTLQLPRELPAAVTADVRRLAFHVTPLSSRGLLSQQIRDALKALFRQANGGTILQIRAFVAGSGDLRRVRDLVSETFSDRRLPLPALSLVRAGGLPLEGAQVVLEAATAARKETNPGGLVFVSAQPAAADDPVAPVAPLAEQSMAALRKALAAAGSEPPDVLRVTCFLSSLENLATTRKLVDSEYPQAVPNYVQTQRAPGQAIAACEAVARLRRKPASGVVFLNPDGSAAESGVSQVAMVSAERVVLTGTQVSFGYQEQDSRLAFERLRRALEQAGVGTKDVVCAHYYPLAPGIATQVRKLRAEFFDAARPPAGSLLLFEGLPSMDAGFAVDVVAAH